MGEEAQWEALLIEEEVLKRARCAASRVGQPLCAPPGHVLSVSAPSSASVRRSQRSSERCIAEQVFGGANEPLAAPLRSDIGRLGANQHTRHPPAEDGVVSSPLSFASSAHRSPRNSGRVLDQELRAQDETAPHLLGEAKRRRQLHPSVQPQATFMMNFFGRVGSATTTTSSGERMRTHQQPVRVAGTHGDAPPSVQGDPLPAVAVAVPLASLERDRKMKQKVEEQKRGRGKVAW